MACKTQLQPDPQACQAELQLRAELDAQVQEDAERGFFPVLLNGTQLDFVEGPDDSILLQLEGEEMVEAVAALENQGLVRDRRLSESGYYHWALNASPATVIRVGGLTPPMISPIPPSKCQRMAEDELREYATSKACAPEVALRKQIGKWLDNYLASHPFLPLTLHGRIPLQLTEYNYNHWVTLPKAYITPETFEEIKRVLSGVYSSNPKGDIMWKVKPSKLLRNPAFTSPEVGIDCPNEQANAQRFKLPSAFQLPTGSEAGEIQFTQPSAPSGGMVTMMWSIVKAMLVPEDVRDRIVHLTEFVPVMLFEYLALLAIGHRNPNLVVLPVFFDWMCSDVTAGIRELNVSGETWALLNEVLKQPGARFVGIVVNLRDEDCRTPAPGAAGHANILLIDTEQKEVERFEPHGAGATHFDVQELDAFLAKRFKKWFGYRYIPSDDFCPKLGLQSLENRESNPREKLDPGGFCVSWSMFWLDSRVKNPDVSREALHVRLLQELSQRHGGHLQTFIRLWSKDMFAEIQRFLSHVPELQRILLDNCRHPKEGEKLKTGTALFLQEGDEVRVGTVYKDETTGWRWVSLGEGKAELYDVTHPERYCLGNTHTTTKLVQVRYKTPNLRTNVFEAIEEYVYRQWRAS